MGTDNDHLVTCTRNALTWEKQVGRSKVTVNLNQPGRTNEVNKHIQVTNRQLENLLNSLTSSDNPSGRILITPPNRQITTPPSPQIINPPSRQIITSPRRQFTTTPNQNSIISPRSKSLPPPINNIPISPRSKSLPPPSRNGPVQPIQRRQGV